MKKFIFTFIGLTLILTFVFTLQTKHANAENKSEYIRGEILVKFKDSVTPQEISNTHKKLGGRTKEVIPTINVQVVDIGKKEMGQAIAAYAKTGIVEYVEPNFIAQALSDDTYFDKQWGLHNIGQDGGTVDADVDAPEAWVLATENPGVIIAILDSGIDQDHPDFENKIVGNIDFTGSSSSWEDKYGHGTHVAGIAAANTNNGIGVAGLAYGAALLNVKVLGDEGYGAYSWIANGIIHAANNGAKVINMSLGGSQRSSTLQAAVNKAWENGVVIVAAAGNSNNPSRTYPAYYSNCIAVAATTNNDTKAYFSSYGKWVDVAAPGLNIYSTFPNHPFYLGDEYGRSQNYDYGNGTSMSTPFVSGLAALVWSTDLSADNSAVRYKIESTADQIPGTGTYWKWGRINACNALGGNCSDIQPPEPPEPPQPADCALYCFKGTCNGSCHPVKEGLLCPDCP